MKEWKAGCLVLNVIVTAAISGDDRCEWVIRIIAGRPGLLWPAGRDGVGWLAFLLTD